MAFVKLVKSLKITIIEDEYEVGKPTILQFDPNGKLCNDTTYIRDQYGRIVSKINSEKGKWDYTLEQWTWENNVIVRDYNYMQFENTTIDYDQIDYNEQGLLTQKKCSESECYSTFRYTAEDDQHNWIRCYENGITEFRGKYARTIIREIEYY